MMKDQLRSPRARIAVGAAGLVLVLAAGWFLLVSPKRSEAVDLEAANQAAQVQLAEKQAALARPAANVEIKASDLFRLTKALPDSTDSASVVLDVDRLARHNKLTFVSITPSAAISGVGTLEQPFDLIVQGRFTGVSKFVQQLRSLVTIKHRRLVVRGRVYAIEGVEVTQPQTGLAFPNVKATVRLSSYSFTQPAPSTPGDPSTTTPTDTSSGTVAAGATP